jgi:hypothetical protein
VLAHEAALGIDVEEGIVEARVAGLSVALVEAHHHVDAGLFGCLTEPVGDRAGDLYRLLEQLRVGVGEHPVLARRYAPHPIRVGRDEGLGEYHQACPTSPSFGDQLQGLGDGGIAVEEHRRRLYRGYLKSRHDRPPLPVLRILLLDGSRRGVQRL